MSKVTVTTKKPQAPAPALKALDTSKVLEPARKKLTSLETQRILAVLDENIKRAQLTLAIPTILNNPEQFNVLLGRELVQLFEAYAPLYNEYEELSVKVEALHGVKRKEEKSVEEKQIVFDDDFWTRPKSGTSAKTRSSSAKTPSYDDDELDNFREKESEMMNRMEELRERMQFMVRCIVLAFRTNPTALTALTEQYSDWGVQHMQQSPILIRHLFTLREILLLRLITTPTEDHEKNTILKEMTERQENHAVQIASLEEELRSVKEHRDNEIQKRNEQIRRLQSDLHQVEQYAQENIKKIKFEAEKQKTSDEKNSESKRQKLEQELNQLKNQLANNIQEHRDSEEKLRRRKWKLENDVDAIIQRYDGEMTEKQNEYESIDEEYTREKQQLHELEERFETLKVEYDRIVEERRIAEEKRRKAEEEMQLLIQSAIVIQSFWRSYKARKMLRGKNRGKGKGKGKK